MGRDLSVKLNSTLKKSVLWLLTFVIVLLSGCNTTPAHPENQEKVSEADIREFYNSNSDLLNKAVEEYKSNTKGKQINIFFTENRDFSGFEELSEESSEIVVWEPETKTNHTEQISKYESCVKTLKLMNDYMLGFGFKQKNIDYFVSVTSRGLRKASDVGNIDINMPYVIEFEFTDVKADVIYTLSYSETLLTEEVTKIDENWYVDVWHTGF